jgi:very-short-patch-repair endonuclease
MRTEAPICSAVVMLSCGFWNDDVLQRTEAVLEQIEQEIERTRQRQR